MNRKVLLVALLSIICLQASAQAIFTPMKDAVKAGDASELAKYLNTSIDLNLEGEVNTYSKAQAEFVLRDFFKKHTPNDFSIVHTGSSKGGLQFAIGKYQSGADNYNVLMRVREVDKAFLIHEMSFTKE
ncbi:MAG TPA: DUF4783 domain-containing protein [Cyclobacteriaceae bacterium]|nr:DUF4783 domain-containing protein [Cyclobacteriaceae bacterium]